MSGLEQGATRPVHLAVARGKVPHAPRAALQHGGDVSAASHQLGVLLGLPSDVERGAVVVGLRFPIHGNRGLCPDNGSSVCVRERERERMNGLVDE